MTGARLFAQDATDLEKEALRQDTELLSREDNETRTHVRDGRAFWTVGGILFILLLVLANVTATCGLGTSSGPLIHRFHKLSKYAVVAAPLLRVFQVYPPVLIPSSTKSLVLADGATSKPIDKVAACSVTQTLMLYSFGNSYNKPFVGSYTPPSGCVFTRVTFNLTVVSAGRQFDRLAVAYFGDTEIWRTSTAEPTQNGIVWTYIKDMSHFLTLFRSKQKLIFDLGNLINNIYTAPFNATLQATFFVADNTTKPADLIVPISARQGGKNLGSAWQYPTDASNTITLPRNMNRAVFTVSATGQSTEEFWYSNVLTSYVNTFGPDAGLQPYSSYREIQIYIDGQLTGVALPFPIIFTGGIVPGFWRPIVGVDAFDLREDEIDISPWLGILCDGRPHRFEIRVAGIADKAKNQGALNNTVGSYWLLTGKIFIWLDPNPKAITTGTRPKLTIPAPAISLAARVSKDATGRNQTLAVNITVTRDVYVESTINTSIGSAPATWRQHFDYSNQNILTGYGAVQLTQQTTSGNEIGPGYGRTINYPLNVNTTVLQSTTTSDFSIDATLVRGQNIQVTGYPVFPTGLQSFAPASPYLNRLLLLISVLTTTQNGTAHYQSLNNNQKSISFGTTQQTMTFGGARFDQPSYSPPTRAMQRRLPGSLELYKRNVLAVNGTLVRDQESLMGTPLPPIFLASAAAPADKVFAGGRSVRQLVGRGPAK